MTLPAHIGIIMDGNGRWAESRGKKRSYGHKKGSDNVDKVVSAAFKRGVKVVTVYAFSAENWQRPQEEVDELMRLLGEYLIKLTAKAVKNKIRIRVVGDRNGLSEKLLKIIDEETAKTSAFTEYVLNIAVNYGGRQEICAAAKKLAAENKEITPENLESELCTAGQPPLDLIIRTGGELRLSNFMTFQSAYSELYFTEVLWPDFGEAELDAALQSFSARKRRFGKI